MSRIHIRYCTQCQWLLRSAWYAQELLSTFGERLSEVALSPSHGGTFEIWCGGTLLWERQRDGGFPDIKSLKQQVRDHIEPSLNLGHVDR